MSQPTIHQLQTLLHRITQYKIITQTDIALLDFASTNLFSSEMANLYNQITIFLSESSERDFLEFFRLVVTYSSSPQTQMVSYSILLRKVAKDWKVFEECNQLAIKQFVIQTMSGNIDDDGDSRVLHIMNQILVCIFRFQPQAIFQDFASSLNEQRERTATRKLINNLSIIRLIFLQAYSQNQLSYPQTYLQFRYQIERRMVSFLTFFRFCLQRGRESSSQMLKKAIEILKLSIEYIPCFDLFNCDIIQYLVGLVGIPQYQKDLSLCFEEIFRFKERNQSNDNHSKIMKKLIFILEFYLERFNNNSRFSSLQEKDCPSTESSYKSHSTKKASQRGISHGKDILILLYQFLNKYAPYIDDVKSQGDQEIQFSQNIKIYYSIQLYDSLKIIYTKIASFLEIMLEELDPFHIDNINNEVLEMNRMTVSCVKNMIILLSKLKIEFNQQIGNIIKLTVCYLTPHPKDFVESYMKYELLQKGGQTAVSMPIMSEELEEEYRQLLKVITKQRKPQKYLVTLFNNLSNCNQIVYEITEADRMKVNMSTMTAYQIDDYCHLKTVNQINRICWSVVYAYQVNPSAMRDLTLMNFYRTINNYSRTKLLVPLYKCLSTNAKYVALISFPQQPLWRALVYAMQQSTLHEDILELILLILLKVFSNLTSKIKISEHEIKMVIDKTRQIQAMQSYDDRIMKMYPALANMLIKNIEDGRNNSKMQYEYEWVNEDEIFSMMICEQIHLIEGFQKLLDMQNSPTLQRLINQFKRLDLIGCKIISIFDGKIIGSKQYACISNIRNHYCKIFKDYEFKYAKFCEYLQTITHQTFDVYHNIEFCQNYIRIQQLIIKFARIMHKSNPKQSKSNLGRQTSLQMILKSSSLLRNTFINQPLFKLKQFFSCEKQLYRYLINSEVPDCQQWINKWITEILVSLHLWYEDESIVSQKYKFMKDVISLMGLKVSKMNMKAILTIFYDFYDTKLTSNHLELIIDVVEAMVLIVKEDLAHVSKNQLDFQEFIDTVKKTFQICFSNHAENQYLFQRVSNILFHEIEIIRKLRFILRPQKKEDNIATLFLLLQQHISQVVNFRQDDDHNRQLKNLIHEHDFKRWKAEMKIYVFYVRRVTLEHNRSLAQ